MTDTISAVSAVPATIANDGSEASIVSATVLTDGAPAAAGVSVSWTATGGKVSDATSTTDANGIAQISVTATSSTVVVTAAIGLSTMDKTITTYTPLAAPIVVNASSDDDYTLDHYDISFGVQAEIPFYNNVALGQTVQFFWGDIDNISFIITETEHPPFVIDVTHALSPDCLKDGTYNVYYVVTDQAGNSTKSSTLNITVADGGSTVPTLPAASVSEADPYININDAGDGVDVVIAYPGMVADDLVTFYWNGFDKSERQITGTEATDDYKVVDGDTSITFTVPMEAFYPNGTGYEGYAEVYYTVETTGSSVLALSDTKQCLVDTLAP
ncbi:MAG TPA: Ig-like domain-containing protein [Scandinavium sp.]|jgi:hypothetical protein|uniref:Ig-like domain-containing protein n=1 Tax=Scandinavium sp. TaxID=2830653 RepID=UPI002E312F01|nr:Ig-like domain-containing protein [Scandinavium sp.]HEX4504008.1 Ig-like domain-containing protein [Scandinavium sp.]